MLVPHMTVNGEIVMKQLQTTELYRQLLEIRTTLLNSQPEAVTGPVH